jgi:hypothetical protein
MKNNTIHRRKTAQSIGLWNRPRASSDALRAPARRDRSFRPFVESVEGRLLLSGSSLTMMPLAIRLGPPRATPLPSSLAPEGSPSPNAYTPAQFQQAYGFGPTQFTDGIKGDGFGQTIAIVDAYNDTNITGDLQAFDKQFNLPTPPSFQVVALGGPFEGTDPAGPGTNNWEAEEALDVEWAHAMAPGASIVLVETLDNSDGNLYAGVRFAASLPDVSVVSMSWGRGEGLFDLFDNSIFTTPGGHGGVTFVAGSGDNGTISYPAASPNVLGVGGTNINLDGNNNTSSETAWSGSGGGVSQYEFLPSYQDGAVPSGTTRRASPDVAYNAGPGVAVYDSYNNGTKTPWSSIGGTSAGAPQWSALIAIANQGRALYGLPTLDGPSQTLPLIYSASSLDFNDITSGSNQGYSARPGYDMVTGLGSPKADLVVYSLIGQNFYLSNGVLTVNGDQLGDNYDDTVTLGLTGSGGVEVTLDGMAASFKAGSVTSVDIITKGGDNTLDIEATAPNVSVSVDMVFGTGTVNISPSADNLDSIQGAVAVTGTSSSDVLNIYDFNNRSQVTYAVTSAAVTRTGAAPITYYWIGDLKLHTGQGNNTCNIESTAQGTPLTVLGGGGDETFNVSPATGNPITVNGSPTTGYLNTIQSNVTINAGDGGFSTLNVNDTNNTQASTWTLSTKTVFGLLFLATYDTIVRSGWSYELDFEAPISGADEGTNKLVLDGGNGNNAYSIESTEPGIAVTLQGGSGNDTYNISPTAKNLDKIQGNVAISGGFGTNALSIFDDNNAKAVTYSVTSSTVTRTGSATISYNSFTENLTLDGGSVNDTYNIESTSAATPVTVKAGSGNNTYNISPTAKNLDNIRGDVAISGGLGANALSIFDDSNAKAVTYSVTSSTVSRTGSASVSYNSTTENLTLDGGSANDTYNIESTLAATPVHVNGGSGTNTLLGPNATNMWTITGANAGTVGDVSFDEIANLTGGSGLDVFVFSAGQTISGEINGGGGGDDWLDYAAYATPVAVNLAAGTATAVAGGIANIRNVRGGQGGNTLTGNAQGNILIGGAGANTIVGGTGGSILIGGKGQDTVTGNSGNDILIAGYTNYDSSSLANDLALESILAEWQSANSYATRISHIKNGGGLNGSNTFAWRTTVHDNSTSNADTLTGAGGNSGSNWFFANLSHTKTNKTGSEQLN